MVAGFGFAVTTFVNLVTKTNSAELIFKREYINSRELYQTHKQLIENLDTLLRYKNEENVKSGNAVNKEEFEKQKKELFWKWYLKKSKSESDIRKIVTEDTSELQTQKYKELQEEFLKDNQLEIAKLKNSLINEDYQHFIRSIQIVKNLDGMIYYASNGENVFTNTDQIDPMFFKKFTSHIVLGTEQSSISKNIFNMQSMISSFVSEGNKIFIAAPDEYLMNKQVGWDKQREYFMQGIKFFIFSLAFSIILFIYLMWVGGREKSSGDIKLLLIDKIFSDINVLLFIILITSLVASNIGLIHEKFLNYSIVELPFRKSDFLIAFFVNSLFIASSIAIFMSIIRRIKDGTFLRHSIIYKLPKKIWGMLKLLIGGLNSNLKLAVTIIAVEISIFVVTLFIHATTSIVSLFFFMLLCGIVIGTVYFCIKQVENVYKIAEGIEKIKNGELDYSIEIADTGILGKMAQDISGIASGLKMALIKETKAERMKTELITNVSHDLKTPLTSIINYADLLSKEKLTPDTANEYVGVIRQKSEKLKKLTQDLFEISKIQSENISTDISKINISLLLNQSIAEFDDQINSSNLIFKINIPGDEIFVQADGNKISRVFENLLSNILKYSQSGSRVYIKIAEDEKNVEVELKNIANYEMDFEDEEILERFVRGDKARTSEGSGLGLAIAKSYMEVCKGELTVKVDGDLFKVILKFKK
jgi:signal transduction histidine kinase